MSCLLRCLAVPPYRQLETGSTGLDSKDKAFPHVWMVVNFSGSRPRGLGGNSMVLENLRGGDKVVSKTVYRCRALVRELVTG